MTLSELLAFGQSALQAQEVALLEAQILLAHVLQCDRSFLYSWPEKEISPTEIKIYQALIARRQQHEPIAYLTGEKEFWSLPFYVTPDTLIPRAETEILVQAILDNIALENAKILDLGTGCGNIACALAHARPSWQICGVDISVSALDVARKNVARLQLTNITLVQSDWFDALEGQSFDAIIGNPPYIRRNDVHLIHGDLPFEPIMALTPGISGLEAYDRILQQAKAHLNFQGIVAFEHGFDQAQQLEKLFLQYGFAHCKSLQDYAGNLRVTIARM